MTKIATRKGNKPQQQKKKSKKKIILITLISIVVLAIAGWWIFCVKMYEANLDISANSYEPLMLHVEDFDDLTLKEYSFPSDKGQMLAGYLYTSGEKQRGIVIMAHGFGGGHNSYMDAAAYFAKNGYYVFAYDATAMDNSGGESLGGTPQGVVDLDHAISFVESNSDIPNLPIVLWGHSWGGYCVSAVLSYHPEVKAVIEISGFNSSSDMFESGGKSEAGDIIYLMTPFIKIHEFAKYGKYATSTAMDGFDSTNASIMIVHSADDDIIGIEYGLDKYYAKYKDNPRFTFIRFEDRGHNGIFNNPNNEYVNEFNKRFSEWLETLDYDYNSNKNKERFAEDKAKYINANLDHEKWSHRLDEEVFDQFLEFYNRAI